jgi:hypothetical protein
MCRGYSRGLGGFVPLSVPGSRTTLAGVGGGGGAAWLASCGRAAEVAACSGEEANLGSTVIQWLRDRSSSRSRVQGPGRVLC